MPNTLISLCKYQKNWLNGLSNILPNTRIKKSSFIAQKHFRKMFRKYIINIETSNETHEMFHKIPIRKHGQVISTEQNSALQLIFLNYNYNHILI